MSAEDCPACGHPLLRHAEQQHWPEGLCNQCRGEMNVFERGTPRAAEDVCKLTSAEVRALLAGDVA